MLNVGTALILAAVLALVTFLLTSDPEPVVRAERGVTATTPPPATAPATSTTMEPATTPAEGSEDGTVAVSEPTKAEDETSSIGPTDIGSGSHFPPIDVNWQRVEIGGEGRTELTWLGELGGRLVAVGSNSSEDRRILVTYSSADGLEWETGPRQELPQNADVLPVVSDGERIYAFAGYWDEESGSGRYRLYMTNGVSAWTAADFDRGGGDRGVVHVQNTAAGPAGLAVAVSVVTYPEQDSSLLEFGDLEVDLDYTNKMYRLIDTGSGDELMSGSLYDIIPDWGGETQTVYDPATGEAIVTIPGEVWQEAYTWSDPLPLPIYVDEAALRPVPIEYGGYVVEIDPEQSTYLVRDAATDEEIANGSLDYLYDGPPPRFVDPEAGTVLLEVTWTEWIDAEGNARYSGESSNEYTTELLVSGDGETWTSTTVPGRDWIDAATLLATGDGFVALVDSYGDYDMASSVWTYSAGEWSSEEREHSELLLGRIISTADGFVAIGEGAGGPAVLTSPDAIDWSSEFEIAPQSDGSSVYLPDLAVDGAGTLAVLAQRQKPTPLVIEKDGYTLTFADGETVLAVIDAAGNVVLSLGWDAFRGDGTGVATWEDGVTYIDLGNGDVISIADDEAYRASDGWWTKQGELVFGVFVGVDGTWAETIVDVDGGPGGASRVCLYDGTIIIASSADPPDGGPTVVVVGSPGV